MPVPTLITQLDTAAANNSPPGTESARGNIDDYLRAHASFIRQVFNGAQSGSYAWAGTAAGTANALTLTLTPAITAYSAGQRFVFKSGAAANTAATTVAVSGQTPLAVQVNGAACAGGEILADKWYEVLVDASLTSCQLMKIGRATLAELGAAALAGSESQQFSVANASTAQHAVALAQADARYMAITAGLNFNGAPSTAISNTWTTATAAGKFIVVNSGVPTTQTLPLLGTVGQGQAIAFLNYSASPVTIATQGGNPTSGTTLGNSATSFTLNQYEGFIATTDGGTWFCMLFNGATGFAPQTWQNVAASRVHGTTYTNSTGRTIQVSVTGSANSSGGSVNATVAGLAISSATFPSIGNNASVAFDVPNGATYSVGNTGASPVLIYWSEKR